MKYPEFKAVYLDKSITFEQWQEGKAARLITGSSNDKIKTALTPLQQKIKDAEDTAFKANGDGKGLERMRGYDVIARPSYGVTDEMRTLGSLLSVFDKSNPILKLSAKELAGDIVKNLENIIKSFGEGSRAFIWFKWNENKSNKRGGHIISAQCQEKNVVNISDPQSKLKSVRQQLQEAIVESICIMRVDNLKFTELVKRCCMNRW